MKRRTANRGMALVFSWVGGFCSLMPLFMLGVIWGNPSEIALIGEFNLIVIGVVLSSLAAGFVCLGATIAVLLYGPVKRIHARRLNAATFAQGAISIWLSIGLWKLSSFSNHQFVLALFMLMASTLLSILLLHELRRRGYLAPPDAGVCANCDYPIGTNEVCTECGKQLG